MTQVQVNKIRTLTGHRDCVYALQSIPGTPIFFSGSGDGMIVQWDLRQTEGAQVAQVAPSVYALYYEKANDLLFVGQNFEGIHILDWRGKKQVGSLKLTSSAIFDIQAFERQVVVASGDGVVSIVDCEKLTLNKRLMESEKSARTIAINPVLGEMAIGYSDHYVRVFRLEDFSMRMAYLAHANSVFTLRYSPDNKWLLSGSRDARLKVWNVAENYALHQEIPAHLYAINDIVFSPDGKHFVTCSMDKSVKVWRTEDLALLKVIDKARHAGHGTSVNKVLWCSHNNQMVSAGDDRTISIWDVIF